MERTSDRQAYDPSHREKGCRKAKRQADNQSSGKGRTQEVASKEGACTG
jgi:hypothetical protein